MSGVGQPQQQTAYQGQSIGQQQQHQELMSSPVLFGRPHAELANVRNDGGANSNDGGGSHEAAATLLGQRIKRPPAGSRASPTGVLQAGPATITSTTMTDNSQQTTTTTTQASTKKRSTSQTGGQSRSQRPRSALAGSMGPTGSGGGGGPTIEQQPARAPSRTTRVRINSTSEQIQDPNWLIRMSQELEMQQQEQKRGHLKALHRKLKTTIANTITGGGGSSSATTAATAAAAPDLLSATAVGAQAAGSAQDQRDLRSPTVPATPTNMLVSILKQRSNNNHTLNNPAHNAPARSPARRSPVPPSSQLQQQQQQQERPMAKSKRTGGGDTAGRSSKQTIPTAPRSANQQPDIGDSVSPSRQVTSNSSTQQQQQQGAMKDPGLEQSSQSATPPPPQPAIKAICADGQVKVSGWKRNNLLAKTLSHFDEIRGNQRPVFVPTKIKLPPEALANRQPQPQPQPQTQTQQQRAAKKFAEIVHEAVSKKNLLAAAKSQETSAICNLLQQHQQDTKRSSFSDHKADEQQQQQQQMVIDPSEPAGLRSMSADGSSEQHNFMQQSATATTNQLRSSSAAGSSSPSSSALARSVHHHHHHHHHHRPLNSSSPQQTSPELQQQQQQSGRLNIQQQQQLINQLQAMNTIQREATSPSPSSSRQFKLQLKNNQVLMNLRRQSNELQAQLQLQQAADAAESSGGGGGASGNPLGSQSSHLKDWKRLAGKLALLTGRGQSSAEPINRNLLSVLSNSSDRGATSSQLQPLRLTVSNQEQSSSAGSAASCNGAFLMMNHPSAAATAAGGGGSGQLTRRGNSQQQLQLPSHTSEFAARDSSSGQPRKLSSSSMVLQPVSSSARLHHQQQQHSPTQSAHIQSSTTSGGADGSRNPRRSSDSEAYQAGTSAAAHESASGGEPEARQPAIVVNRNDLLQLLQVTGGSNGFTLGSINSAASEMRALKPSDRSSQGGLRTQSDSAVQESRLGADGGGNSRAASGSTKSVDSSPHAESSEALQLSDSSDGCGRSRISDIVKQRDIGEAGARQPTDDDEEEEGSQTTLLSATNNSADEHRTMMGADLNFNSMAAQTDESKQQPELRLELEKKNRGADLSWVVKQTSKVALFQQKLRKIRWHTKHHHQHEKQQQPAAAAAADQQQQVQTEQKDNKEANCEYAGDQSDECRAKTATETTSEKSADVFMDPELIGDAIEIFLRNTMQSNNNNSQPDDGEDDDDDKQDEEEEEAGPTRMKDGRISQQQIVGGNTDSSNEVGSHSCCGLQD